jgi:hypothetical protein
MGAASSDHEDTPGAPRVVVPDDASALEPDRQAWLTEQRSRRRRAALRRLVFTRRWERFGLSGPLVVLCLMVVSVFGGMAVVLLPRQRMHEAAPAPLTAAAEARVTATSAPDVPVAETVGGAVIDHRLVATTLEGDVRTVSTSDLRPAVVLLVGSDCACAATLRDIYRQAREFRLGVWLVGERRGDETTSDPARSRLVTLDEQGTAGGARWAVDSTGVLTNTLVARGLTLIAVRADGTVAGLRRDLPLDPTLLPPLEPLLATLIKRTG